MTEEQEKELSKLIKQLEDITKQYNKKAKKLGLYNRVGYMVADYSYDLEEMKENLLEDLAIGEELDPNWEDDFDPGDLEHYSVSLYHPEAEDGWFPSDVNC